MTEAAGETPSEVEAERAPPRLRRPVPSPMHAGINVWTFYAMHAMAAIIPLGAGWLLYGWRGPATVGLVVLFAWMGLRIWRKIGWRGAQIETGRCLWMSVLLGLALPAHLLSAAQPAAWPLVPAAGLLMVIVTWLLGGLGSGRVHPMLVTYLAIAMVFHSLLIPQRVLRADCLMWGDLFKTQTIDPTAPRTDTWASQRHRDEAQDEAFFDPNPAAQRLVLFTSGRQPPERSSVSLEMVLRDQLPPLEDFVIGGQPSAIGTGSALAVIVGGLFLIYRGLIDYRIPLLAVAAAAVAMLILPVPLVITTTVTQWRWLAFRSHYLGWPAAVTFVNYELMASPLLFVVFFLATAPIVRPTTGRGRTVFAIMLGLMCGPAQLYASVSEGPYVALLVCSMATPLLDRVFGARPLV